MNLFLYNNLIYTNDDNNSVLKDHAIAVEKNIITDIGPQQELQHKYPGYDKIDGGGRLLMPGLINSHMHFYGTYARGLALQEQPHNFYQILKELWWKLDSVLDLEAVYYSTLVPAINAIRLGVTSIIDHHASPNAVSGSLDVIEDALSAAGIRAVLCYEISDRDGEDVKNHGLHENSRYISKCQAANKQDRSHLYDGMVGLHASFTLDDITLQKAADLGTAKECGCHIHLLEDLVDRQITKDKYNSDVVRRLLDFGILGEKSIAAHGIHLQDSDFEILKESKTNIVHNPQSNMNNAVGRADIEGLVNKGVMVGLGTDGMSAGIWPDARSANLLLKHDTGNPNSGRAEIQKMLLKNNPHIYRKVTGKKLGKIEKGYLADIILVDYFPPTPLTKENIWGHLLFGVADATVDTTIINGKIVMRNKEISTLDEAAVAAESRICAEKIWKKFSDRQNR